jgi:hypothetical protein
MTFAIIRPTTLEMLLRHDIVLSQRMGYGELALVPREEEIPPQRVCRRMYRGDTLQIPIVVVDDRTRQPLNVTGWGFRFTAKYALQNPDVRAAMRQDNQSIGGVTLVAPTMGQGLVVVQPIATRAYPDGDVGLYYDVQATDPSGVITTIEIGSIVVRPDVTLSIGG